MIALTTPAHNTTRMDYNPSMGLIVRPRKLSGFGRIDAGIKVKGGNQVTEHLCKHGNYHCNICEVELLKKVVEEYKTENERIKKWETFDGQMRALFMENFHLGESRITIADYMQAQLDLGIIEIGGYSDESNPK